MAKPPPAPAARPTSADSIWPALGLAVLIGLLVGATGMYLTLRSELRPAPAAPVIAAAVALDPALHVPPPDMVAGLPPAQADRTLGNFYYDQQNWPLAIRSYESAIKQGSNDADIRTDLGNAYRFSHRPDEALIQYRLAQELDPQHEFSLFNQGGLYLEELHQPQQAIEAWTGYLRRFPQGRNAAVARQLIAQAGAPQNAVGPSGPAHVRVSATNPNSAEVDRLLSLVTPGPTPGKP